MIPGLDCYSGYGRIDWAQVAAAGYRFAIAKMGEGNEPARDDTAFLRNIEGMRANGIIPGGYFYCYPLPEDGVHKGRSATEQCERAFQLSMGLGGSLGELPHCLDAEFPEPQDWHRWAATAPSISEWLRAYCERAVDLWGRKPLIYTYPSWWRFLSTQTDTSWASEYGLWLADYGWKDEGAPPDNWRNPHQSWVSRTWLDWQICQHSADGSSVRIPGVPACPVDRNCIKDATSLARLIGTDAPDTEPAPFNDAA